jgi:hypothetical protein
MPFLKKQIEIVNNDLLTGALSDKRFLSGRFEAIAVDVSRQTETGTFETFPAVMSKDYEAQEIAPDDTYPITIYHKVLSKTAVNVPAGNYGDSNGKRAELVTVKMVVIGKYAALQMTAEELEALIVTGLPDQIASVKLLPYKLDTMAVAYTSTNFNTAEVFAQEYRGIPLFLAPEDIMFSIQYTIGSTYRKGCFTICDCGSGTN